MTPEQQFVDAWKKAAPVLEELQAAKLRAMRPEEGALMLGANASPTECFYSHGLARWQAWMMRWRVLESLKTQTGQLDTQIIVEELTLLAKLKEAPELVTQLQSLLEKYH